MMPQLEMTPERWHRITEVFHSVLSQPPAGRDEHLKNQCGDDAGLYSEVRHMLDEHGRSGYLDRQVLDAGSAGAGPVFSSGQIVSGRYRIVRFLSRGGMGEVYEAEDLELKIRVALKTLLPAIAADADMIARFKQEIQLSRKIPHPNVCRVFDLNRHPADGSSSNPTFFLTMEFLDGETLAARIGREGRMTTEAAFPLIEQMADALDAAHRSGVIHRDFKPSNVMLAPSGEGVRAVVTDFGLARSFAPSRETTASQTGHVMGTLDYMAPELLTGGSASAASDVYALGMVAHQMVTGVLPFADETPLAGAILRSNVPLPSPRSIVPDLDPKWDRAILRALNADRMKRFSRPLDLVKALRGETASIRVSLPAMSRRTWIAAVAALLVLAAAWVGWRTWERARNEPSPEAAMFYQKGVGDIQAGAYFAATRALGEALRIAPRFSMAHARLAEAWVGLEMPEKARYEMQVLRRQDISALSKLDRLRIEAVDRTITNEFADAAAIYEQIRNMAPQDMNVDLDLGRAYEGAQQPDKAIECYRRAAEGKSHNPAAWLRLAVLYERRSERAKSDAAFLQAEQLYQFTSNLEGLTEVALRQGIAADRRNSFDEAARFLERALGSARSADNVQQEIRIKLQLATHYYQLGDSAGAEKYARAALETAQANQVEILAISGIVQLGNAYRNRGDPQGAAKQYSQALTIARANSAHHMIAVGLLALASVHSRLGRSEESGREAREALAYYQSNGFVHESAQCLVLLGRSQRDGGDLAGAREAFEKSLQMAEKAENRSDIVLAHQSIASLLSVEEDYPGALTHLQKGLDATSDARSRCTARLLCGIVLAVLGREDAARAMFDAADGEAAKFPSVLLDLAKSRAEMALQQGRYAEAAGIASHALDSAGQDPPATAALQGILGQALIGSGRKPEGLRDCEESLSATLKLGDADALLRARFVLAQARLDTGDRNGALRLFDEMEPALATRAETRWRALALKSRIDPQVATLARRAFDELHARWGDTSFQRYTSRPDVQKLSRPLL